MKPTLRGAILALAALVVGPPALAGSDYSSENVVKHFTDLMNKQKQQEQEYPLTGARSVVIGTTGFSDTGRAGPGDERFNLLITFEYNSDRLTTAAMRNLDQFAKALRDPALLGTRFAIEGHTDATGSATYNQTLSERRAQATVAYLTAKGIGRDRLDSRGFGESRLKSERGDDPINRRVEARLIE
jgi:outer membrane protein OmpA-like peptidoglycan-associated protein